MGDLEDLSLRTMVERECKSSFFVGKKGCFYRGGKNLTVTYWKKHLPDYPAEGRSILGLDYLAMPGIIRSFQSV